MPRNELVGEWFSFAEMDLRAAQHLYETMYPQPYEIICYHCQQAIEKALKGHFILHGIDIQRTHDLGLLAERLQPFLPFPERYLDICDDLTPYGVKVRYPQELTLAPHHVSKAMAEATELFAWLKGAAFPS